MGAGATGCEPSPSACQTLPSLLHKGVEGKLRQTVVRDTCSGALQGAGRCVAPSSTGVWQMLAGHSQAAVGAAVCAESG